MTTKCSVIDCEALVLCKELCKNHYYQKRNAAKRLLASKEPKPPKPVRLCSVEGCGRKHRSNNFCTMHLSRHRKGSPLTPTPKPERARCKISCCNGFSLSQGMCNKHYLRLRKTGTTESNVVPRGAPKKGVVSRFKADRDPNRPISLFQSREQREAIDALGCKFGMSEWSILNNGRM